MSGDTRNFVALTSLVRKTTFYPFFHACPQSPSANDTPIGRPRARHPLGRHKIRLTHLSASHTKLAAPDPSSWAILLRSQKKDASVVVSVSLRIHQAEVAPQLGRRRRPRRP